MNEKQVKAARELQAAGSTIDQIAELLGLGVDVVRNALRGAPRRPTPPPTGDTPRGPVRIPDGNGGYTELFGDGCALLMPVGGRKVGL